jgi:hypothetical protein
MAVIRWKIYYGDGTTFSNRDGLPENAPALNVQAVTCCPEVWMGGDIFGLFDYLSQSGKKIVKFGRMVSNVEYTEAVNFARNDPYFDPNNRFVFERVDFYWWVGKEGKS